MKAANELNELALNQIATTIFELEGDTYLAQDFDDYPVGQLPSDALIGDQEFLKLLRPNNVPPHVLKLKVGALCCLTRNIDKANGLVNNARVVITRIDPDYPDVIIVKMLNPDGVSWREDIPITRVTYRFFLKKSRVEIVRRQFPLTLDYASTIHRSQGQTLNRVVIDVRRDMFTHGQLYVAIGRAKGSDGILFLCNEDLQTVDAIWDGIDGVTRKTLQTPNVTFARLLLPQRPDAQRATPYYLYDIDNPTLPPRVPARFDAFADMADDIAATSAGAMATATVGAMATATVGALTSSSTATTCATATPARRGRSTTSATSTERRRSNSAIRRSSTSRSRRRVPLDLREVHASGFYMPVILHAIQNAFRVSAVMTTVDGLSDDEWGSWDFWISKYPKYPQYVGILSEYFRTNINRARYWYGIADRCENTYLNEHQQIEVLREGDILNNTQMIIDSNLWATNRTRVDLSPSHTVAATSSSSSSTTTHVRDSDRMHYDVAEMKDETDEHKECDAISPRDDRHDFAGDNWDDDGRIPICDDDD